MQRFLAAAAALVFTGTAQAAIINGQFTATIDGGNVRVFNPDFTVASDTPIAPGTSFNGTFRIDTSLLPPGVVSTVGDPSFVRTITQHQQAGGPQWLTGQGTLGLGTPLGISFGREATVARPPGTISPPGFDPPAFDQAFTYIRSTIDGFGHCCDSFGIDLDNTEIWALPDFSLFVAYSRALQFEVTASFPFVLDPDAGFPDSGSFINEGIDPQFGIDHTFGSGTFAAADYIRQAPDSFSGTLITGEFTVLTASFVTVTEVPAPGAPLLLAGAFLLRAARRQRVG